METPPCPPVFLACIDCDEEACERGSSRRFGLNFDRCKWEEEEEEEEEEEKQQKGKMR